jgi:prepilin-type processing-associated H-X9-DG protein
MCRYRRGSQIIAILAAILFPVFAKAREKAKQAGCISNEKQIALAVQMYAQDYDERYPMAWSANGQTGPGSMIDRYGRQGQGWMGLVQPYTKNAGLFTCPAAPDSMYCDGRLVTGGIGYITTHRGGTSKDAQDGLFPSPDGPFAGGSTISTSYIFKPADTCMFWDAYNPDWWACGVGAFPTYLYTLRRDVLDPRHSDMVNIAWCDGHAKPMKPTSLRFENFTATPDD